MKKLRIRENVPLAPFSTFGIGGRARYFFQPKKIGELKEAVEWAAQNKHACRVFAGGSNVVFPDEGFDGLLIRVFGGKIKIGKLQCCIVVDAGVLLADVIKKTVLSGWAGLETLSGIPGTIGGAVVGNAGAYGHSISEVVQSVEFFDVEKGEVGTLSDKECEFGYRDSIFKKKNFFILSVCLCFQLGDKKTLTTKSREIIKIRKKKYKPGLRCPGSFFKNVLVKDAGEEALKKIDSSKIVDGKIPAGYLLEDVGAKGMREGGIYIADFHGNLFVNDGGGTAAEVKKLSAVLKKRVGEKFGIRLEEEIRYF